MKKLRNVQIFSKLVVATPLTAICLLMRNFIGNFVRILGICKDFAGNRVNELGNIPRCGVVPKFSGLEVIALGITAEAFGFDSENFLSYRLRNECKDELPNLIGRRQFNVRRKGKTLHDGAWQYRHRFRLGLLRSAGIALLWI